MQQPGQRHLLLVPTRQIAYWLISGATLDVERGDLLLGLLSLPAAIEPTPARTTAKACQRHIVSNRKIQGQTFTLPIFAQIAETLAQPSRRCTTPGSESFAPEGN